MRSKEGKKRLKLAHSSQRSTRSRGGYSSINETEILNRNWTEKHNLVSLSAPRKLGENNNGIQASSFFRKNKQRSIKLRETRESLTSTTSIQGPYLRAAREYAQSWVLAPSMYIPNLKLIELENWLVEVRLVLVVNSSQIFLALRAQQKE